MGYLLITLFILIASTSTSHAGFVAAAVAAVATSSAIGSALISLAATLVSSLVSSLFAKKPKVPSFDIGGLSFSVREPVTTRRIIYGRQKVSGPIAMISQRFISNNVGDHHPPDAVGHSVLSDHVAMVIMLCTHEIDEIEQMWFDDEPVWFIGSGGMLNTKYKNTFSFFYNPGTNSQPALQLPIPKESGQNIAPDNPFIDPNSIDTAPGTPTPIPGTLGGSTRRWRVSFEWDNTRKLSGIAHAGVVLSYDRDVYKNGVPNISFFVKGRKIWDPRISTWSSYETNVKQHLNNPALCLLDYLLDPRWGRAVSIDDIDIPSFVDAAHYCDTVNWQLHGAIDLDRAPEDIISKMLSTFNGSLSAVGGIITVRVPVWTDPVLTITESDIVSPVQIQTAIPFEDRFNFVRGEFYEAGQFAREYKVNNAEALQADGEELEIVFDQPFINSRSQAENVAGQMLKLSRGRYTVSFAANLKAMKVRPGDLIRLDLERYGFNNLSEEIRFLVTDFKLVDSGGSPAVELSLRSVTQNSFTLDATGVEIQTSDLLPVNYELEAPSNLIVSSGNATYVLTNDGTVVPKMNISWVPLENRTVSGYQIDVFLSGDLIFSEVAPADRNVRIVPGIEGRTYTVRVAAIGLGNTRGEFAETSHTVVGKTNPPTNPGSIAALDL